MSDHPARGHLRDVTLRGFKTIRDLEQFEIEPVNILIGPNGAGKSNFVAFFRLLWWALAGPKDLPLHVGTHGGSPSFLFDGPATTESFDAALRIETDAALFEYQFELRHGVGDTLVYSQERYRSRPHAENSAITEWIDLGTGHRSPRLLDRAERGDADAKTLRDILRSFHVFQFHNTSLTARMRGLWDASDGRWLRSDGGNLGASLHRLKKQAPGSYQRIVSTLQASLPCFSEFVFEEEHRRMALKWRERGTDRVFGAWDASDGMLRFIALATLLLGPENTMPNVILIDEPELGLHPFAIEQLIGMIQTASRHAQIVLSTQSVALLDYVEPSDIVVVDRKDRTSIFRRLDPNHLRSWLDEYSLSELWEMNVLGGRPA